MSSFRKRLVNVGVVLLVLGSSFDIVTGREHWPFSPYSMFSRGERGTPAERLLYFGVPADTSEAPFALMRHAHLAPFDRTRLSVAFKRMDREGRLASDAPAALANSLERYERLRQEGRHDGPPLRGLRLYRVVWVPEPGAPNILEPGAMELVAFVGDPEPLAEPGPPPRFRTLP